MTIATELARRIRAFTYDGLPDAALEWAKTGILDTVGVTLAGSAELCAQIMLRVCTATGPALVFGSAQRVSVTDAALVNGTASHALDFDDCSNTLGGHPSVPILPGLFALADAMPVSGRDFLAAYVAGFETETRIARAVNFHHYDKGWHPTATLGSRCPGLPSRQSIAIARAAQARAVGVPLDAKFSVQYCLARALVDGQVVLSHFHDDAYLDARVADVMARIEAAPHPQMLSAGTAHFGAEVTVTTTDGRRLVKVVDSALGRTSEQPLSRFALEAKYRDCAGRVLTPDAVDRSLDLVADMETLDRASVLADTLAAGCACDQAGEPAALARAS